MEWWRKEDGLFWQELSANDVPVILFGAGNKGQKALEILHSKGVRPKCFCDNNPALWGTQCGGLPVKSYEEVRSNGGRYTLLLTVTSQYATQIQNQLKALGETNQIHQFTVPFKVDHCFLTTDEILQNKEQLEEVFGSFEDESSQDLFKEFIKYKHTGNAFKLKSLESGDGFFSTEFFKRKGHHFVDAGAFTGDSVQKFLQFSGGEYQKIDAFELDEGNFNKLKLFALYGRVENIQLHNCGLWNEDSQGNYYTLTGNFDQGFENPNLFLNVQDTLDYDFREIRKHTEVKSEKKMVELRRLDVLFQETPPTLIKINALAADFQVLEGAEQLLNFHKPSLVIDYGSKPSHLWEIPLFIKRINPNYKLYLRQKSIFGDSKTILYAV